MRIIVTLLVLTICTKSFAQSLLDCSSCSATIIKNAQIKDLSIDEIRLLSNEIFARNGFEFKNQTFATFFESKKWYISKKDNKNISFNQIEKQNIKLFQDQTNKLKSQRAQIIAQLKKFKTLVLSNKLNELKSTFNFGYEKEINAQDIKFLKEVLGKIDFDDINYYKHKGLHSTTVDNGFVKILFELSLEKEQINLYYNYMNHSKIIADFDEFTDYHSEDEFMYNWQFEFKTNKLKFIRFSVAG